MKNMNLIGQARFLVDDTSFSVTPWTDLSDAGVRLNCWTISLIRYFPMIGSDGRRQNLLS